VIGQFEFRLMPILERFMNILVCLEFDPKTSNVLREPTNQLMKIEHPLSLLVRLVASLAIASYAGADPVWKPVPEKMMTTWGSEVTPENAWREYPRPQFEPPDWQNLNGLWGSSLSR